MFKINHKETRTKKKDVGGGGDAFSERGCGFYIKNKLKSSIFDDEKFIFLCHN